MVLRIVDDLPAFPAVVHHGVQDVGTRLPLVDPFDPITLKFGLESLVEIDLGAFAQLFGCLLFVGALQFLE